MRPWLILALALAMAGPAGAAGESVVLGLSQTAISITTSFTGSDLLIYGAVKRDQPPPPGPLEVVVAIAGPSEPVTVRRKERRFGIWMNIDSVDVDAAPSFYAVATSAPWKQSMTDTEDLRYKVSVPRAIRSVGAPMNVKDSIAFSNALIRIRSRKGLYQLRENTVDLDQQTLFTTRIEMPADLTEGDYPTRIFLTRGGRVVSHYETVIEVSKVGLERWLYRLSHNLPFIYGALSLAIAIAAGWGASAVFRLIRRG